MVGYYNYTVWLTYFSLVFGGVGICFALSMHPYLATIMLAVSGICDLFDGKIARTKKDRTDNEKHFGIEIDSLCDLVCFGCLPLCIGYCVGMKQWYFWPILVLFIVCGMIRLAYYNVLEFNRTPGEKSVFYGLPITTSAIIIPFLMLFHPLIGANYFYIVYAIILLILTIGYIVKIRIPKPSTKTSIIMVIILMLIFVALLIVELVLKINGLIL